MASKRKFNHDEEHQQANRQLKNFQPPKVNQFGDATVQLQRPAGYYSFRLPVAQVQVAQPARSAMQVQTPAPAVLSRQARLAALQRSAMFGKGSKLKTSKKKTTKKSCKSTKKSNRSKKSQK